VGNGVDTKVGCVTRVAITVHLAEGMPAERMPVERMPAERMPAERMPAERMPAERMPAERMPAYFPQPSDLLLGASGTTQESPRR
jgi:hypothetical protein